MHILSYFYRNILYGRYNTLYTPGTKTFLDPALMDLGTWKHIGIMVYKIYNSTFISQTDPKLSRIFMNLLDLMYLAYIHSPNIFFY